ncbi:hypothetical protein [Pseudomonas fluorescens]|uniref:hypothetical protein n=1 Tax=Pseudomonas fluorescens TaxID=294 RepID=UPI001BE8A73C|nr:hypothetical protein [Pseudomonas fluorescens]MBT2370515.1 hypothetical protein [Pseudomonas fluorescens]
MANATTALSPAKLLGALLITTSVFVTGLYSPSSSAASMMVYCIRCQEDSVDATKWVRNGMYRLATSTAPDSEQKMIRNKPVVFTADDNDPLIEETIRAMDIVGEKGDSAVLQAQWPNLTRRVRYSYSIFMTSDQLVDFYEVYVRVGRNKYVIVIGRDVASGEFMVRSGEGRLINRYGTEGKPRDLEQFKKIETAADR